MKEEILTMKKEIGELREQSLAMEIYQDSKKANKRICWSFTIVIIMLVIMYFATVALFLQYIDSIGYEEVTTKTQELTDIDNIENSNIVNGDFNGYDKTN